MFPISISDRNIYKFKYTVVDAQFTSVTVDIDCDNFDMSRYIVVSYITRDTHKLYVMFATTETATYLNNRFYKHIPFPVGKVSIDNSNEETDGILVGTDTLVMFTDVYELYTWLIEVMQLVSEVRFYAYSHNGKDHIIRPIEIVSERLNVQHPIHVVNKDNVPFLADRFPSWEIHKKMNAIGNDDNETNFISNKYEDLPTIHLTEDQFNCKPNAEFYCHPYLNEDDNEYIFAWYPKTYTCFKGFVNIWERLRMNGKEYQFQRGKGYLPKHIKTIKTVEMFEGRFRTVFNRMDTNDITKMKHVMVSFDGGIMGKIDGNNLRQIMVNHYDPKDDPDSGITARMIYGKD